MPRRTKRLPASTAPTARSAGPPSTSNSSNPKTRSSRMRASSRDSAILQGNWRPILRSRDTRDGNPGNFFIRRLLKKDRTAPSGDLIMFKKCLAGLVLVVLAPLAARAGGEDRPAAVVRFRSLDALVDNVKLIVTLAGNEGLAQQVEGLIKAKIGAQGLEGIDPARPFGAYARFGKGLEDIGGAVLIPIASEKAFLTLLDNLDVRATKEKNDIYKLQTPAPVEVYLRFANRYA